MANDLPDEIVGDSVEYSRPVSPKKKGHHHRTDVTGSTQAQAVCGWWSWLSGRRGGKVAIKVSEEGGIVKKTRRSK
jgi:hypothetical protein